MAEKQSAHREYLEKRVVDGNVANQTRGSYFAFTLCVVAIIGGVWLIHSGMNVAGLVSIIGSLATLAGVFVYSKQSQKKERQEKASALETRRNQK
jgi:uncharacterized membrane protein